MLSSVFNSHPSFLLILFHISCVPFPFYLSPALSFHISSFCFFQVSLFLPRARWYNPFSFASDFQLLYPVIFPHLCLLLLPLHKFDQKGIREDADTVGPGEADRSGDRWVYGLKTEESCQMPCGKLCAGTRVAKCFSLTDAILERGVGKV